MVVDDNCMNRKVALLLLERAGQETVLCEDGAEAVHLFANQKERPFDIVVMDLHMPAMDGLEAAKRIRALGKLGQAAVICLSTAANVSESDFERFKAQGIDFLLSKPLTKESIRAALRLCDRHPSSIRDQAGSISSL